MTKKKKIIIAVIVIIIIAVIAFFYFRKRKLKSANADIYNELEAMQSGSGSSTYKPSGSSSSGSSSNTNLNLSSPTTMTNQKVTGYEGRKAYYVPTVTTIRTSPSSGAKEIFKSGGFSAGQAMKIIGSIKDSNGHLWHQLELLGDSYYRKGVLMGPNVLVNTGWVYSKAVIVK